MKNIFEKLTGFLKQDDRLASQDGVLLKNKTQELARKNDPVLIKLLLSEADIKKHFFFEVDKTLIFDKEKFIRFISNKQFLPDSYTAFKNKIGLATGDSYLSENRDTVLVWPYKDCILEGGMTKEDQKRDEIFYNETLAPDEVNRLLDPKVFTGFKRVDKNGEHVLKEFKKDEKGNIKDNLMIKGNNLLAIASLKKKFSGKVKLVYIDPPYNTGNDGFKYNDSFNHSSWLVFMKNRLEIARTLLKEDGVIFVQCDDNESAYLKVLMDEVFGRDNYRNSIYWHRTYAGKTISKNLPWNIDTILFYSKNPTTGINNITKKLSEADIASFNKDDNDGKGKYNTVSLQKTGSPGPQTTYDYKDNKGRVWKCPAKGWRMTKEKLKALENDGRLYITNKTIREKYYLNERMEIGKQIDNLWNDIGNMNRNKSEDTGFAGQKPERLLQRIIDLTTSPGDIILDFFGGSGTTASVAHKMGRQHISIEQMSYCKSDSFSRLKNVIKGDQSNVSKSVDWVGGGDFVYLELARWNESWVEKIEKAKTEKELARLFHAIKATAFLSYKVNAKSINDKAEEFNELNIKDQKIFLMECLDKNHLYVNYSEMEDKDYGISKEDQALNKEFYKVK
jgi:adenine-specific DNA-methyltransferase